MLIADAQIHLRAKDSPSARHRQTPFPKDEALATLRVFDAFGPQRMFWGTDITRMSWTWRKYVTLFTKELPWLSGSDLELVMGRAFCDWIGWETASG